MRDTPLPVNTVTKETAPQMIEQSARRHRAQREIGHPPRAAIMSKQGQQEVDLRRMRELWCGAESAAVSVEGLTESPPRMRRVRTVRRGRGR